jgi:hypothetical protein
LLELSVHDKFISKHVGAGVAVSPDGGAGVGIGVGDAVGVGVGTVKAYTLLLAAK